MTAPVVNTVFVPGTTITHEWLNGVNDYVNGQHTSDEINYTPPFTGAVTETVTDKLAQYVSVKDFGAVGDGVTDDYAAIQAALDAATYSGSAGKGWQIDFPAGTYLISQTLEIPNATVLNGAGRQQTVIRPYDNTFAGVMMTDKGNAGKIFLQNFRIEAMGYSGVTNLIKMGYGTQPLGQAVWTNLFFSGGLPGDVALTTCTGIDVVTNVFDFVEIEGGYCGTDFKLGPNSTTTTYDKCYSIGAYYYAFLTNGNTNIVNCEIEGPAASCVPIYVTRECNIQNLTFSQSNDPAITNPYIVRTDPNATLVTIDGLVSFSGGGISTLTNTISEQRSGYPAVWGDTGANERRISSLNNNVFTKDLYILNLQRQAFKFQLYTNSGGTIYHKIASQFDNTVSATFVNKINGASVTGALTPTGTDASTAFVSGAKISSAYTNLIILDTANQAYLSWASGNIGTVYNTFGTALIAALETYNLNVNGVTANRLCIAFYNAATGAPYNLTSISGTASKYLTVNIEAYVA